MKPFLYESMIRMLLTEAGSGMFQPGQRFWSSRKICARFRVSAETAVRALGVLVAERVLRVGERSPHILEEGGAGRARILLPRFPASQLAPQRAASILGRTAGGRRRIGLRVAVISDNPYIEAALRRGALFGSPKDDPAVFGMRWHHMTFLRGISRYFYEADFYLDDGSDLTRSKMLEEIIRKRTGAAAIFRYGGDFSRDSLLRGLQREKILTATILDDCEGLADASVDFNNQAAGYAALRILAGCGHRRVAILTPHLATERFAQRAEGARLFVEDGGRSIGIELSEWRMLRRFKPPAGLLRLLAQDSARPSALFLPTIGDFLHLSPHLERLGLRVPRDLSVLGCGAWELLERPFRWLDLLRQDFGQLGDTAAGILHRLVEGESVPRTTLIEMPHEPGKSVKNLLRKPRRTTNCQTKKKERERKEH